MTADGLAEAVAKEIMLAIWGMDCTPQQGLFADDRYKTAIAAARRSIAAHTKALEAAGMVCVPREPSFEMLAAFNTSVQASLTYVRMKYDNVTLRRAIAAAIATPTLPPAGDER